MPARPSHRAQSETHDIVFVLGAGVDKVFGLPLLNTLFHDLGDFARGPGKGINAAIKMLFTFRTFPEETPASRATSRLVLTR